MGTKNPQFMFDTADEAYIRSTWEFLKTQGGFEGSSVIGITTNPNALSKINCNDMETFNRVITSLCRTITEIRGGQPGGIVFAQFPQMSMSVDSMRRFVNHIVTLSDGLTKVGLKIPPYEHVLKMVPEFSLQVETNVTGLADCATAIKCLTYGVRYISIINGRMEENGIDARGQVQYIKQANLGKTEIITASMRTIPGLAWVIEEDTLPTIGSRVFDQFIAKGAEGAKEFRQMWNSVKSAEFSPNVTDGMKKLSLAFFEQMDSLGESLRKSFEGK